MGIWDIRLPSTLVRYNICNFIPSSTGRVVCMCLPVPTKCRRHRCIYRRERRPHATATVCTPKGRINVIPKTTRGCRTAGASRRDGRRDLAPRLCEHCLDFALTVLSMLRSHLGEEPVSLSARQARARAPSHRPITPTADERKRTRALLCW